MKYNSVFAFTIFRAGVCLLLLVHGISRLFFEEDGISSFGAYLDTKGLIVGNQLAGAVTLLEIGGSILIAIGKYVRWLAPLFVIYLLLGVLMVHWHNGWFVVGHSLNGMEYNVLLILCMLFIWAHQIHSPVNPEIQNSADKLFKETREK